MSISEISNRFKTTVRNGRFSSKGPKFRNIIYNKIELNNSINSFYNDNLFFTNFTNSKDQEVYKIVKDLYERIQINDLDVLREYTPDEMYISSDIPRLIELINISSDNNFTKEDIVNILEYKFNKNKKVHLYIIVREENGENFLEILLIDLFHLSICGDIKRNGKVVRRMDLSELKKDYFNKYKKYGYNLNNLVKEKILVNA